MRTVLLVRSDPLSDLGHQLAKEGRIVIEVLTWAGAPRVLERYGSDAVLVCDAHVWEWRRAADAAHHRPQARV